MKETANIHLLLVEDNARYLEILERRLRRFGYEHLTTTRTAAEAREVLQQEQIHFDIIVSDMRMEQNDSGFDIIDLVQDLKLSSIVIILTANDSVKDARKVLHVKKAWDYISKGYEDGSALQVLHESIQNAIKHLNQINNRQDENWQDINMAILQTELTVFVEGPTDVTYMETAASLLGHDDLWKRVYLDNIGNQIGNEAGGESNMTNGFKFLKYNRKFRPHKVLFLFDQDVTDSKLPLKGEGNHENLYVRRTGEYNKEKRGTEYLFNDDVLEAGFSAGFVTKIFMVTSINPHPNPKYEITDKSGLCNWLCTQHLTSRADFANFEPIFQLIQEILDQPLDK